MKKCSKCGTQMDDDFMFCPNCGYEYDKKNICPHCNKEVKDDNRFCPYCGGKIKEDKICPNCGKANDSENNFCDVCGYNFNYNNNIVTNNQGLTNQPTKVKQPKQHLKLESNNKFKNIFQTVLYVFILLFTLSTALSLIFAPIYKEETEIINQKISLDCNFYDISEAGFKLLLGYNADDANDELNEIYEYIEENPSIAFSLKQLEKLLQKHNYILLEIASEPEAKGYVQTSYVQGTYLLIHALLILAVIVLLFVIFGFTLSKLIKLIKHMVSKENDVEHNNKIIIKLLIPVIVMSLFAGTVLNVESITSIRHSGIFIAVFVFSLFTLIVHLIYELLIKQRKFEILPLITHTVTISFVIVLMAICMTSVYRFVLVDYDGVGTIKGMAIFSMLDNLISEQSSVYYSYQKIDTIIEAMYDIRLLSNSDILTSYAQYIFTSNEVCLEHMSLVIFILIECAMAITCGISMAVYLNNNITNLVKNESKKMSIIPLFIALGASLINIVLNIISCIKDDGRMSAVPIILFIIEGCLVAFTFVIRFIYKKQTNKQIDNNN